MLKVLLAAAEAAPFAKTGGLGDVVGSLPKALKGQGIDARVVIPLYHDIPVEYKEAMQKVAEIEIGLGWRRQICSVQMLTYSGVLFYFIGNDYYYKRSGVYCHFDDAERYAFFNRAVIEMLPIIGFQPDIIHCNDWHTGMIGLFLKDRYMREVFYQDVKTVFTIHNLAYQGVFSADILSDILDLNRHYFTSDGIEYYDQISFMKAGIIFSDVISTVSKSYSEEIQTAYYGETLHGVLSLRKNELYGIVNGIDYEVYNPYNDKLISSRYHRRALKKRSENKAGLQQRLGLPVNGERPVLALVSRLVAPKGIDLIAHVFEEILHLNVQLVVLGKGEPFYEQFFLSAKKKYSDQVAVKVDFDEVLAHQIFAGADLFLMPSRFEPCGITQLIAMRYGSIPIVRETGGLKDTVIPYNKYTQTGTGFSFANYNAHELLYTIKQALEVFDDSKAWAKLIQGAMTQDFSWKNSAKRYIELYRELKGLGDADDIQ